MISDIDINDWQMLTTPLKLEKLKEGDMFSVFGDSRMYKIHYVLNEIAYAETREIWNSLVFPRAMEVYPWVINKNVNLKSTNN
jgi:hypothetical protein